MEDRFSGEDWAWLRPRLPGWKLRIKRGIDLLGASAALLLLSPVLLAIALAVKVSSRGPVFFLQERAGYLGKRFFLWKFRTMVENALELGGYETGETDPRITKVGKFLREWTLDEIPQFWNVFKGEMSLVGPRPALPFQTQAYTDRQKRRLLVKPGMTGLAQVSGRNALSWPERIALDLQYIEHYSLGLDLKILLKTIGLVLTRKGIYGR